MPSTSSKPRSHKMPLLSFFICNRSAGTTNLDLGCCHCAPVEKGSKSKYPQERRFNLFQLVLICPTCQWLYYCLGYYSVKDATEGRRDSFVTMSIQVFTGDVSYQRPWLFPWSSFAVRQTQQAASAVSLLLSVVCKSQWKAHDTIKGENFLYWLPPQIHCNIV